MDELEKQLQNVFQDDKHYDALRGERLQKEVVQMYENKLKKAKKITWAYIVLGCLAAIVGVIGLETAENVKEMIYSALLILVMGQMLALMKLWYWIVHCRISIQKDLRELILDLKNTT